VLQQVFLQGYKPRRLILLVTALIILALVYFFYDPASVSLFPRCPFNLLTGLECPGCGSQRAIHHLLNLELFAAFRANALVVISIPYILIGIYFGLADNVSERMVRLRIMLFGTRAIYVVLVIIITFWIVRNVVYIILPKS
jgi:hypothetical protein